MKSNKYENLNLLNQKKLEERKKRNLKEYLSLIIKILEYKLEKNIIPLYKMLSKIMTDKIFEGIIRQEKTQKMSHPISSFQTKFLFDYFFSLKKPFNSRFTSFCGASPGNNSSLLFSSLLFSSLLFSSPFMIKL